MEEHAALLPATEEELRLAQGLAEVALIDAGAGCVFISPGSPDPELLRIIKEVARAIPDFGTLNLPDQAAPRLFYVTHSELTAAQLRHKVAELDSLTRSEVRRRGLQCRWSSETPWFKLLHVFDAGSRRAILGDKVGIDPDDRSKWIEIGPVTYIGKVMPDEPPIPPGGEALQVPREELEYLASALRRDVARATPSLVAGTIGSELDVLQEFAATVDESLRETAQTLGLIALRVAQAESVKQDLDRLVLRAREQGVTWSDIGRAAGMTPQSALRRWSPEARRKHSEYQRERWQQTRRASDTEATANKDPNEG